MKRAFKIWVVVLIFLGLIATGFLMLGSGDSIPVLQPKGFISEKQRDLIITASLLMLIVVIPVLILNLFFAWRYRSDNKKAKHTPDWEHNSIAEYCWWGVPLFIVVILSVITWRTSHSLNPFRPIKNGTQPIEIQVVALEWKWLFIYPEQGIAVVNYVQFPEKTPLNFQITADAPMNSFWIPQLGGQIYAMPAMRTKLHLMANETGIFRGASANLSGKGFAGMSFNAEATTDEAFHHWVQTVKATGKPLNWEEFQNLTLPSEYNPVTVYVLQEGDLFDQILMKYMAPKDNL